MAAPPPTFTVWLSLASQSSGSINSGLVGTMHAEEPPGPSMSRLTRIVMRMGGVGELGPLVLTSWPDQSTAGDAGVPDVVGNRVPALSAIVSALLPSNRPLILFSSNMSATPSEAAS